MGYKIRTAALGGFLLIAIVSIAFLATDHPPDLPSSETSNSEIVAPTTSTPGSQSFSAPHLETVAESTPPPTVPPGARISGVIVDIHGKPMAGMRVDYGPPGERPHGGTPLSGDDGRFEIVPLSAGTYALIAQREDSWGDNEAGRVEVTLADNEHLQDLRLVFRGAYATISGSVTDTRQAPIAGARVQARSYNPGTSAVAQTDASGQYTLFVEPDRDYRMQASHSDYALSPPRADVRAGGPAVDFLLEALATLAGHVLDARTGAPVTSFEIMYPPSPGGYVIPPGTEHVTVKNAAGEFTLARMQPGDVTIAVRAEGFAPATLSVPRVSPGEHRKDLIIRLEASAQIKGIVINEQGAPVHGVKIYPAPAEPSRMRIAGKSLSGIQPGDTSGEDGRFVLNNIGSEVTALTAEHPEYALTTLPIHIAAGQSKTVTITMTQGAAIEGMITIDGVPAPNQDISVLASFESSLYEESDASGFYRVERLPEGSVVLRVSLSQNNTRIEQEQTVSVRNGDVITVDFNFESGNGGLEGIVTLDGAAPAGGGTVIAFLAHGEEDSVGTAARLAGDGSYRMDDLVPGPYRVWVRASAEANTNQRTRGLDVEVSADGVTRLDIELPDRHIRGVIHGFPEYGQADVFAIDAESAPGGLTAGAPLTPAVKRVLSAQSHVQQDGAYDLAGLVEGRYILIVVATNQPSRVATILAVDSGVEIGTTNVEHNLVVDWDATQK